jgi:hypothetical protein
VLDRHLLIARGVQEQDGQLQLGYRFVEVMAAQELVKPGDIGFDSERPRL